MKRQSQHIWRGTLRLQRSMARLTINIQPQLALLKPTHKKESYSDDASDLEYCRTFKPIKKKNLSRRLVRSSPQWFRAGNKRGKGENGQSKRGGEDSCPSSDRPERIRKYEVSRREMIELVEEWGLHFSNWSSRPWWLWRSWKDEFWTKNVHCKRMRQNQLYNQALPPHPLRSLEKPRHLVQVMRKGRLLTGCLGGRARCNPQSFNSDRQCYTVAPGEGIWKTLGHRREWHPGTQSKGIDSDRTVGG